MVQESVDNHNSGAGTALPLGLPSQTRLGEFEIISVIGEGGFSIVYLAHDHQLQRTVAIKEYLPGAIAYRNAEGVVLPRFEKYDSTFKTGLQSFLKEARILAQFEHHSLIRIHRFWEQNGTAYMVMQYCQGKTLRQVLQNDPARGRDEQWLKQVMAPVLDALRVLHSRSCYHRDLSPDNIMILDSGAPMLLDFGAARQVIGDMTQALTVILKPGFAPIEQYADDESMRQGPWTDIYGAGAVLYFATTGKAPTASVARLVKDPLKKLASLPDLPLSPQFAGAVDHALSLFPADRPQSIDEFASELMAQDAPVSHFQTFPTLSGAAVVASSNAAKQESLQASSSFSEHSHTGGGAAITSASASEPVSAMAQGNELLQPAHEEWSSLLAAPAPAPALTPPVDSHGDERQHPAASPASPQAAVITPEADAYLAPVTPVQAPAPQAAQQAAQPAHVLHSEKKRAAALEKKPAVKRRWGLYAGLCIALLVVLVALAHFFDGGRQQAEPVSVASQGTPDDTSQQSQAAPDEPPVPVRMSSASEPEPQSPVEPQADHRPMDTMSPSTPASTPVVVPAVVPVTTASAPTAATSTRIPDNRAETSTGMPVRQVPAATASTPVSQASPPVPTASPHAGGATAGADGTGGANQGNEVAPRTDANNPAASGKPGAYVRFVVRPWGKVTIDGVERGNSPPLVRLWLPEGDHSIVIENGDFPNYSTRLKVVDKKDTSISHKFGQ